MPSVKQQARPTRGFWHGTGLMDTFLQNPLGNPLAGKPVLEWFPSFGPTQFAVGGSFGQTGAGKRGY